jgi:hypothetical protein
VAIRRHPGPAVRRHLTDSKTQTQKAAEPGKIIPNKAVVHPGMADRLENVGSFCWNAVLE